MQKVKITVPENRIRNEQVRELSLEATTYVHDCRSFKIEENYLD